MIRSEALLSELFSDLFNVRSASAKPEAYYNQHRINIRNKYYSFGCIKAGFLKLGDTRDDKLSELKSF